MFETKYPKAKVVRWTDPEVPDYNSTWLPRFHENIDIGF